MPSSINSLKYSVLLFILYFCFMPFIGKSDDIHYTKISENHEVLKIDYLLYKNESPKIFDSTFIQNVAISNFKLVKDPERVSNPNGSPALTFTRVVFPKNSIGYVIYYQGFSNIKVILKDKLGKQEELMQVDPMNFLSFSKNEFVYYINPAPGDTLEFYSILQSNLQVGLEMQLYRMDYFFTQNLWYKITSFSFLVVVGLSILFVLLFAWSNSEKIYWLYLWYLISAFFYLAYSWNLMMPLKWMIKEEYYQVTLPYIFMTIAVFFYGLEFLKKFGINFYSSRQIKIWVGIRVAIFILGYYSANPDINHPFIDFIFIFPVILALLYYKDWKNKIFQSFLLSFGCLAFLLLIHSYEQPYSFYSENKLLFQLNLPSFEGDLLSSVFITIEIIFFNFSIYQIFRMTKMENASKQKELIRIKDEMNEALEQKVKERTIELESANAKILNQSSELKLLNERLEASNLTLQNELEIIRRSKVLQNDVSFNEFCSVFTSSDVCLELLAGLKWEKGFICKKCRYRKYYHGRTPFSRKCRVCKTDESPTVNTLFDGIKIPLEKAFYIVFCVRNKKNLPIIKISEELSLRPGTCQKYYKKAEIVLDKHQDKSWIEALLISEEKINKTPNLNKADVSAPAESLQ